MNVLEIKVLKAGIVMTFYGTWLLSSLERRPIVDASALVFTVWCAVVNDSSGFTDVKTDPRAGGDFVNITAQN